MADAHGKTAYTGLGPIVLRYGSRRSDTTGLSSPGRMRVVEITVNNVNVELMVQERSDPQERQGLAKNILRQNAAVPGYLRRKL